MDVLTYAGNLENLKDIQDNENYTFIKCDICDFEKVKQVFEKHQIDSVIHLAAESHVDRSIDDPLEFINTNIVGTAVLLDEALNLYKSLRGPQKEIFRFLHVSTDEVYGSLVEKEKFIEYVNCQA